jgi:hypothetical protein
LLRDTFAADRARRRRQVRPGLAAARPCREGAPAGQGQRRPAGDGLTAWRSASRGRYAARFAEGTNLVLLDPDVAAVFPDARSVNSALRKLAEIIREHD